MTDKTEYRIEELISNNGYVLYKGQVRCVGGSFRDITATFESLDTIKRLIVNHYNNSIREIKTHAFDPSKEEK